MKGFTDRCPDATDRMKSAGDISARLQSVTEKTRRQKSENSKSKWLEK